MPHAYLRLLRLHQRTGIWLLLWPCWWSLALATHGKPPLQFLLLFALGAVVMRAAGCIVNDWADRRFDAQVERTRTRPLASGEIELWQAGLLLVALLCIALAIALQMPFIVPELAALSLPLVLTYPFMKRITFWPQAFLGLTFNWGTLMGWAAVREHVGWACLALYAGCIFWTLGYDTIYAHQDKRDDAAIGVRSTALLLGAHSKMWITLFYALALAGWSAAGWLSYARPVYYLGMCFAAWHLLWQVTSVRLDEPASCLRVFRSNAILGLMIFAGTGSINGVFSLFIT
jgi:4-hydroxybenzoate polyprenyltransferase